MTEASANAEPLIRCERHDDVEVIWLADAQRRNALSVALVGQLIGALRASRVDGARAVVLASREKAFCAGADMRDMLEGGWLEAAPAAHSSPTPPDLFEAIEEETRPVIAAVEGAAFGGGVELCLSCDLVVAGPSATFMFPELGLGVLPNTALARLPGLIGSRAAADLILTRRRVGAEEALRLGMISSIAEGPSVVDRAVEIAAELVAKVPPTALAAAKRALRRGPDWNFIRSTLRAMDPAEWREGTTAFLERRSPDYQRFWLSKV